MQSDDTKKMTSERYCNPEKHDERLRGLEKDLVSIITWRDSQNTLILMLGESIKATNQKVDSFMLSQVEQITAMKANLDNAKEMNNGRQAIWGSIIGGVTVGIVMLVATRLFAR